MRKPGVAPLLLPLSMTSHAPSGIAPSSILRARRRRARQLSRRHRLACRGGCEPARVGHLVEGVDVRRRLRGIDRRRSATIGRNTELSARPRHERRHVRLGHARLLVLVVGLALVVTGRWSVSCQSGSRIGKRSSPLQPFKTASSPMPKSGRQLRGDIGRSLLQVGISGEPRSPGKRWRRGERHGQS